MRRLWLVPVVLGLSAQAAAAPPAAPRLAVTSKT